MARDQLTGGYVEVQTLLPRGWVLSLESGQRKRWRAVAEDPGSGETPGWHAAGEGATEDEAFIALAEDLRRAAEDRRRLGAAS
jgi:hypothetical protein